MKVNRMTEARAMAATIVVEAVTAVAIEAHAATAADVAETVAPAAHAAIEIAARIAPLYNGLRPARGALYADHIAEIHFNWP